MSSLSLNISLIKHRLQLQPVLNSTLYKIWHCTLPTYFSASASALSFRAGSSLHGSGGTTYSVSSGSVHGSYNSRTMDYDIAVLRPSSAFATGSATIRAVSLTSSRPSNGATAYVSGWGTTSVSVYLFQYFSICVIKVCLSTLMSYRLFMIMWLYIYFLIT